jgi:YHS domain-containing protein
MLLPAAPAASGGPGRPRSVTARAVRSHVIHEKDGTMKKISIALSAAVIAFAAQAGELDNQCVYGLSLGKSVKTDCKVHKLIEGKDYCFSSEDAMSKFEKDEKGNLAKALKFAESQPKKKDK